MGNKCGFAHQYILVTDYAQFWCTQCTYILYPSAYKKYQISLLVPIQLAATKILWLFFKQTEMMTELLIASSQPLMVSLGSVQSVQLTLDKKNSLIQIYMNMTCIQEYDTGTSM